MPAALALARYLLSAAFAKSRAAGCKLSTLAARAPLHVHWSSFEVGRAAALFSSRPLRAAISSHRFYLRLRSAFNPAAALNLAFCGPTRSSRDVNVTQKVMNSPRVISPFFLVHCLRIAQFMNGAVCLRTVQDLPPPPRHQPVTLQNTGVSDEPSHQTPCSPADQVRLGRKTRLRLLDVAAISFPVYSMYLKGSARLWQRLIKCRSADLQEADCDSRRMPMASSKRPLTRPVEKQTS